MVLKHKILSMALLSALFGASHAQTEEEKKTAADAQEADADANQSDNDESTLDAIVVTGIRQAIETAINLKQENSSIVEVISAEDIGKLPDTSIAESIARLPGLTAQRVAGRSSTISIRGLSGDFSTTLLNGREQVSSGDNRGVEFDQYPSELLSGVVVYKTPDANLVAQGISGTVDLRTVRPLQSNGRTVALNARFEKNGLEELNPGYTARGGRFSFSFIDKFFDETVGVAIGIARLDSPGQANRWNAWGYADANGSAPGFIAGLGGSESFATSTDNARNGFMSVVEFKPNDFYTASLDAYYSNFKRSETTRGLQTGIGFSGATFSNLRVQNDVIVQGTATGIYGPVIRNDLNDREDDIAAFGFKNEFSFDNGFSAVADFSLSRANRDESILETYSGIFGRGNDNVDLLFNVATGLPQLTFGRNYSDPNQVRLGDPGGWGQDGYIKFPKFKDELRSALLSGKKEFDSGFISSVEGGVNISTREKSRNVAESFLELIGARPVAGGPQVPQAIPNTLLQGPADLRFTGIPGVVGYDINRAYRTLYRPRTNINPDITNKDWEVEETVSLGFAKMNIDTNIGDLRLRGNAGLQYVHADQESQGFAVPGGNASAAQPFTGGDKYGRLLPSLNLGLEFLNGSIVRFGAARQQARPRLDQMRANNNFGIDAARQRYSGGGGNPELRPWESDSFDLSYEWYFADNRAYISGAAFHKDLNSYIYDQGVDFDFSVFNLTGLGGVTPTTTIGRFSRPTNGEGGTINGYELAFSAPADLAWDVLEGFGIQGSYSDTRSSILPNGPGSNQPLPGLSRYVGNLAVYFEQNGFSARIAQRGRSSFIGEVQGFGADRETRYVKGETILDFQTGYEFKDGNLQGLSVLLQVNNLDNEPYQEFYRDAGAPDRPRSYNEYGRTVLFGVNYKF